MIVKARFDGRAFVPESPVDLPVGCEVEIPIDTSAVPKSGTVEEPGGTPRPQEPPLLALARLAGQFPDDPDWPEDGSIQHDHYLYGTPRRSDP